MSLNLAEHSFEGPFDLDSSESVIPANRAAVYVIFCNIKRKVVDVGESGEVEVRLANHDRRSCWKRHCVGNPHVYLHYMPSSEGYTLEKRHELEGKIRERYAPDCGSR